MPVLSDYVSGTISLTNGEVEFTGTGTGWLLAGFKEGDTIIDITGATEYMGVIASIDANGAGTLTKPWEGPTLVDAAYRMRYQPDGARTSAQARSLIEILGNGNIQALAGLEGSANKVPMFTGPGAMTLVPKTDLVSGANYDVQVANLVARAAYNGMAEGFSVLVSNTGDGRSAIYSKVSNTSGDWSAPAYVTGPAVTLDVTEVDEVPYGAAPDVTLTPRAGGYDLAFDLPRGMIIEPGTVTTLPPDQQVSVDFVPITGGYRLDIAIPKGPTGDINGVTPFWNMRLGSDSNQASALAGLGAQPALGYTPANKAGDAFTGDMTIAGPDSQFRSLYWSDEIGRFRWALGRWPSTGNLTITRYDAAGNYLNNPLYIDGSTGRLLTPITGADTPLPSYGCRAFVNFEGAGAVVRASGNVSSVTRYATGQYTVNLATAMPDANYTPVTGFKGSFANPQTEDNFSEQLVAWPISATQVAINAGYQIGTGGGFYDPAFISVAIFR